MRNLSPRERRTIRVAGIAVLLYLAAFFGFRTWRWLEGVRARASDLRATALEIDTEWLREQSKLRRYQALREKSRLDPSALVKDTLVSAAWEAMESCATARQLQLGPAREAPGRGSAHQLRVFQFDGVGPTQNAMEFLHDLRSLGFPLVVEQITVSTANLPPGQVRLTLTVPLFDYESWKGAARNA